MSEPQAVRPVFPMGGAVPGAPGGITVDNLAERLCQLEMMLAHYRPYYADVDTHAGMRRLLVSGIDSNTTPIPHQWKVSLSRDNVPGSRLLWDVGGGNVYCQGEMRTVAPAVVSLESGVIWLQITRDEDSRMMIEDTEEGNACVISSGTTMPESDYSIQYFPLAIIVEGRPIQLWHEEARVFEELVVVQGELKFMPYYTMSRNYYDLPT